MSLVFFTLLHGVTIDRAAVHRSARGGPKLRKPQLLPSPPLRLSVHRRARRVGFSANINAAANAAANANTNAVIDPSECHVERRAAQPYTQAPLRVDLVVPTYQPPPCSRIQ